MARRGRPLKFGRAHLSMKYQLRVTAGQLEEWKRRARAAGRRLADWIREQIERPDAP